MTVKGLFDSLFAEKILLSEIFGVPLQQETGTGASIRREACRRRCPRASAHKASLSNILDTQKSITKAEKGHYEKNKLHRHPHQRW